MAEKVCKFLFTSMKWKKNHTVVKEPRQLSQLRGQFTQFRLIEISLGF